MKLFSSTLVLLLFFSSILICDDQQGDLSIKEIHELIQEEIKRCLKDNRRFTLLPNNIDTIYASPFQKPTFRVTKDDYYHNLKLLATGQSLEVKNDFRYICDGRLLGSNEKGEVVISRFNDSNKVLIGKPSAFKTVTLSRKATIKKAHYISNKWFLETKEGFYDEEGVFYFPGFSYNYKYKRIIKKKDKLIFFYTQWQKAPNTQNLHAIVTLDENGATLETLPQIKMLNVQGMLEMQDGSRMLIASRLGVSIKEKLLKPSMKQLEKALVAFEKDDLQSIKSSLELLTKFDYKYLKGFAKSIRTLSAKTKDYKSIYDEARRMISSIRKIEASFNDPSNDNHGQQKKIKALKKYLADSEAFIKSFEASTVNNTLNSPSQVARFIMSGYQYYDGHWLVGVKLLSQYNMEKVLISAYYIDPVSLRQKAGVFYLKNDGSLTRVLNIETFVMGYSRCIIDSQKKEYIFFPKYGLGYIEDNRFIWLDQSAAMQSMDKIIGSDALGRMYFSQNNIERTRNFYPKGINWVYRPEGKVEKKHPFIVLPFDSKATVDSFGRIWFVHNVIDNSGRAVTEKKNHTKKIHSNEQQMISKAQQRVLKWKTSRKNSPSRNRSHYNYTLFCYSDGQLFKYFSDMALNDSELVAGSDGAMFILGSNRNTTCFVIEKDVISTTSDLHLLAKTSFDLLLRCAPVEAKKILTHQRREIYWRQGLPSLCKVGQTLWINQNRNVEAYRKGTPLKISRKLKLLGGDISKVEMFGPLNSDGQNMILLTDAESISKVYWVKETDGKVLLTSTEIPGANTSSGTLTHPELYKGRPLISNDHDKIFFHHGFGRVFEFSAFNKRKPMVSHAGVPSMMLASGELLTFKSERVLGRYRLMENNLSFDINVSYLHQMAIFSELKNGQLLCSTPIGPAILKQKGKGQYEFSKQSILDPSLSIVGYIGQGELGFVFIAKDSENKSHLVIGNMK